MAVHGDQNVVASIEQKRLVMIQNISEKINGQKFPKILISYLHMDHLTVFVIIIRQQKND
jgi:hypothetical protein